MSSEEWKYLKIYESPIEIIDGDRGVNYPKQDEFSNDGYCLFLNTGNVTKHGFDFVNTQFITKQKDCILRKGKLKKDDIVFTTRGTVGNVAHYDDSVPYENIRINSGMVIFRNNNPELIATKYFYFFLRSKSFFDQVISHSSGSAQPQLPIKDLREIIVPLPSITTQRRIAEILSALDEKIELNRQTNATLEAMAQAIFDEWFVRFNFPGDDGVRVESELGPIPRGWRVEPLDKIANFLNGLPLQKYPAIEGESYLPVIKIRELKSGITDSTDRANTKVPPAFIIHDGDLIFSWSGSLEVDFWVGGDGALNQHLFKVTSEIYPLWFCYLWIKNHLDEFRGIAADKTTTMGHIQRHHLSDALCLVPENFGQIDRLINPLISRIIENKKEMATLAKIRDALLPKLMNGEIEV